MSAGEALDFTPTEAMAAEAERGLQWFREHGRGGTKVGEARARDIKNRKRLSAATVRRMTAFFERHGAERGMAGWGAGEEGHPCAERIRWSMWGGDPARTWANGKAAMLDDIDDGLGFAAQPDYSTGIMVCVRPVEAEALAVDGGYPPGELHVTLGYFGVVDDHDDEFREVLAAATAAAIGTDEIGGEVSGVAVFEANADRPMVALIDSPELEAVRAAMVDALDEQQDATGVPVSDALSRTHAFLAHCTLGYDPSDEELQAAQGRAGMAVTFRAVELVYGDEREVYPFGVHPDAPDENVTSPRDEPAMTATTTSFASSEVQITAPGQVGMQVEVQVDASMSNAERAAVRDFDWRSLLAYEGDESGDRRMLAEGALTWRDLPLTLYYQFAQPEGLGNPHALAVIAGSIWDIERDGNRIWGHGFFDRGYWGMELRRQIDEGSVRGVSIDADANRAELVWEDDDEYPLTYYTKARIMAATVAGCQALPDAVIEIVRTDHETAEAIVASGGRSWTFGGELYVPAAFVSTGSSDLPLADRERPWDGDEANSRMQERCRDDAGTLNGACFARGHLHREPDADPNLVGSYRLPFADVIDGELRAVYRGVAAAAGRLDQTDMSDDDRAAVKSKVNAYYRRFAEEYDDPSIRSPFEEMSDA